MGQSYKLNTQMGRLPTRQGIQKDNMLVSCMKRLVMLLVHEGLKHSLHASHRPNLFHICSLSAQNYYIEDSKLNKHCQVNSGPHYRAKGPNITLSLQTHNRFTKSQDCVNTLECKITVSL